ncbi:hypothetical protein GO986_18875 [Deinococcus sp. HMF7620]|uniref:Bulb-type lectin domain-containing protein n=1 Tax=Deinococcus arboris TaxID=2682977 RepID=A0A7C9HU76_9DEIO|nr:hypothetical protein [Deinococcus arboris]MVN88807.1 hypothetical protein [Deinococcus arboris]
MRRLAPTFPLPVLAHRTLLCSAALLALGAGTAGAWKPSTHLAVAEEAMRDALDDGQVSIQQLSGGQVVATRQYPVDPTVLQDLRTNAAQYRAGVVGPDAYPDLLTGQQMIHPGDLPTGNPQISPGNSDAWLQHLFQSSRSQGGAARAFTTGFITHAAGDMFAHSLVNHYTGGPFELGGNAVQHLVLEGYIGKRTPNIARVSGGGLVTRSDLSISGAESFIYQYLIDAKPGTPLHGLYQHNDSRLSVPAIFSKRRAGLQRDIDEYYAKKADYQRRIRECRTWDFSCSRVALSLQLAAYVTANAWKIEYKEHWRADIDTGLRAWPRVSADISSALIFTTTTGDLAQGGMEISRARQVLGDYVTGHILSMMGAPDLVGQIAGFDLLPPLELAFVKEFIRDRLDSVVQNATGMSLNDWQLRMTNPENYFDATMNLPGGAPLTLTQLNRALGLTDTGYTNAQERFNLASFAPTANTLTLSKLVLLSQGTFEQVIRDLGGTVPAGLPGNAALGFIRTFDGDHQWNASSLLTANSCAVYYKLFRSQDGDGCGAVTPVVCPDTLASNTTMNINEQRVSCSGRNVLIMQGDGNLVLYKSGRAAWASQTWGNTAAARLTLGGDGHLALYRSNGQRVWTASTWGHPGAYLKVQDDGNVVLYEVVGGAPRAIWSTNTWGP